MVEATHSDADDADGIESETESEAVNEALAASDLLETGETERDHGFEGDVTTEDYNTAVLEAFWSEVHDGANIELARDGSTVDVETENFVASASVDETAECLRATFLTVEYITEDHYLLYEGERDAEGVAELPEAREQFRAWKDAEHPGEAALTVGERNPGLADL